MATSASPNKIMMKETTKMSLNDRFTVYRKQNQQHQQQVGLGGGVSDLSFHPLQQQRVQRQASARNQRLALQMANRSSVLAALKLKKKSLRQRLGQDGDDISNPRAGNVKSRLSFQPFGVRGRLGNVQGLNAGRSGNARLGRMRAGRFSGRGAGSRPSGTSPMLKGRLGGGSGNSGASPGRVRGFQNQNKRNSFKKGRGGVAGRGRGGFARTGFRQQQQQFRAQANRGRQRGAGRNNAGSSRGGRGFRRKGNWGQQSGAKSSTPSNSSSRPGTVRGGKVPSKQDLDNDLDEYMAKTKSHLDAELDAYMAQTE